jgi:hypothetical protein
MTPLQDAQNRLNALNLQAPVYWDQIRPILEDLLQAIQPSPGAPVQTVTITLNQAQIENLGDTPIIAIPQAPAGQANILLAGFINYNFGTTPYENFADLQISYATSGTPISTISFSLSPAVTDNTYILNIGNDATFSDVPITNDAVVISAPGNTPSGGDGTFTFYLAYALANLQ